MLKSYYLIVEMIMPYFSDYFVWHFKPFPEKLQGLMIDDELGEKVLIVNLNWPT